MKPGAENHPKLHRLAQELQIPHAYAVGMMLMLWQWARKFCPQGDIGKWDNKTISVAAGWDGDEEMFLPALEASRLIDRHPQCRWVIHDWHDHIDKYTKQKLDKEGLKFFSINVSENFGKFPKISENFGKFPTTIPNHTLPNPTSPDHALPGVDGSTTGCNSDDPWRQEFERDIAFEEVWNAYPKEYRKKKVECQRIYFLVLSKLAPPQQRELHREILEPLLPGGKWAESETWNKDGGRWICSLETYLSQQRWQESPKPRMVASPSQTLRMDIM